MKRISGLEGGWSAEIKDSNAFPGGPEVKENLRRTSALGLPFQILTGFTASDQSSSIGGYASE